MNKSIVLTILITMAICIVVFSYESQEYVFDSGNWETYKMNGYEFIISPNLMLPEGGVGMPYSEIDFTFPKDKNIREVSLLRLENPKEVNINIPMILYTDDGTKKYLDIDCLGYDTKKADATLERVIHEDNQTIARVKFSPLEMTNCNEHKFKMYQSMKIAFVIDDMNAFASINYPRLIHANSSIEFEVTLNEDYKYGTLEVINTLSGEGQTIDVEESYAKFSVDISSDPYNEFEFSYYEGDTLLDTKTISLDTNWGDFDFRVLKSQNPLVIPLAIDVENKLDYSYKLDTKIVLIDISGNPTSTIKNTLDVLPGNNMIYLNVTVKEGEEKSDIDMYASYQGFEKKVEHNTIIRYNQNEITNELPAPPGAENIEQLSNIVQYITQDAKTEKEKPAANSLLYVIIIVVIVVVLFFVYNIWIKKKYH